MQKIHIIFPAHFTPRSFAGLDDFKAEGFDCHVHRLNVPDLFWPDQVASRDCRLTTLLTVLSDPDGHAVVAGRGGYGSSDLLPLLPWHNLRDQPRKWLVGFSDISALLSAFYTQLGWKTIHGPMPLGSMWGKDQMGQDTAALFQLFKGKPSPVHRSLFPLNQSATTTSSVTGLLFGGNLQVLTNLIGTPYMPANLADHILFFEDVTETPQRLFRSWNQWIQSGLFENVRGLILGQFTEMGIDPGQISAFKTELGRRAGLPTWSCEDFGHGAPNFPLVIGQLYNLENQHLIMKGPL